MLPEPLLRYGDAVGVPVWLAVETRPLPIEQPSNSRSSTPVGGGHSVSR